MSAVFSVSTGCSRIPNRPLLISDRFIDSDPVALFDRGEIVVGSPVFEWDFVDGARSLVWTVDLADHEYEWTSRGLEVHAGRRYFSVSNNVEFDASTVDSCEIVVRGLNRKPVAVEWARPGELFDESRRIQTSDPSRSVGELETYSLLMREHPLWQGEIERLKFSFVLPRSNTGVLESFVLQKDLIDHTLLATASEQDWIFEIDNEVRPGWLGVPGLELTRIYSVPRNGLLQFSLASVARCDGEIGFRVDFSHSGSPFSSLFAENVDLKESKWRQRQVDLASLGGEDVIFRFTTDNSDSTNSSCVSALPVWGNPEVLSPADIQRPNLVLVVIDTLRADHLPLYGYDRNTTPNIDVWSATHGATVFEKVVAPASWTLPSHASIFSGLDAHRHGVNHSKPMPRSVESLVGRLRDQGYATVAVTGGGFVHPSYGFSQGFDEYRAFSNRMGFDREIEINTGIATEKIRDLKGRNFFLFFHTYEVHNPYRPRQPGLENLTGRETELDVDVEKLQDDAGDGFLTHRRLTLSRANGEWLSDRPDDLMDIAIDLYDAGISHADRFVGRLLAELDVMENGEDTVVVVTSDHGELFGEHGEVNHYSVYDENVFVPLIIKPPGSSVTGQRVRRQVRSVDIMPTLLDYAGLPIPEGIDGTSLRESISGDHVEGDIPTRPAFSYASASNYGLSMRDGSGLAVIMRNGAWEAQSNRTEVFMDSKEIFTEDLKEDTERKVDDFLRRIALQVEGVVPGIRILVNNSQGNRRIDGSLRGPLIGRSSVKISNPQSGILRPGSDGAAVFSVEPHSKVIWVAEGLSPAPLWLDLDGQRFRVDLSDHRAVLHIDRTATGWGAVHEAEGRQGDGVTVWWSGRSSNSAPAGIAVDSRLRDQLEALGYVE